MQAPAQPRRVIVAGGGGPLGAAVVEQLLACADVTQVVALVERPLAAASRRLRGLTLPALAEEPGLADTAVVVFDRPRGRHGREDVFLRPPPHALGALARQLLDAGVRRLLVVLPHAPALLPQALKAGLATLDEQAVAALGFEQLVFVRSAQRPGDADTVGRPWLQRVADAWLRQLHWLVPLREQPVRADKVAAFVVALAQALPQAPPGTRVAPPELVWQAAQPGDLAAWVAHWLADGTLPALEAPRQRW